jgi:hypothetical protein
MLLNRLRPATKPEQPTRLPSRLPGLPSVRRDSSASSAKSLEGLREFFGAGRIYVNRRHDNHKEDLHQYIVGRRDELLEKVIPFFRAHPLQTAKRADFEKFAACLEIVASDRHLTARGLIEIAEIAETMNHRKPRQDLIRILRGHTPNIRDTG